MYRFCFRTRPLLRNFSSSRKPIINSTLENSQIAPPPILDNRRTLSPVHSKSLSRTSVVALSAAAISAVVASAALLSDSDRGGGGTNPLHEGAERAARKAADSFDRILPYLHPEPISYRSCHHAAERELVWNLLFLA